MMRVYLSESHGFPKRIGEFILAYYANNNVVILRKPVKRTILAQNINIKNNQSFICFFWSSMSINIKSLFGDYAKVYKCYTMLKRAQGVSGFSMFIYFLYRLQKRYSIAICDMTVDFIMSVLKQYNSIKKLMRETLLYYLHVKHSFQNEKLIFVKKELGIPLSQSYINTFAKEVFCLEDIISKSSHIINIIKGNFVVFYDKYVSAIYNCNRLIDT
ncbi:MAG: hypothetical protein PHF36_00950 [Candidatus Cloacimonetes bacterium]|nr:hypothetical protein [Candidatus Cloacimonadota bacterium]